jgi:putative Mn2+ efflux pump MntP
VSSDGCSASRASRPRPDPLLKRLDTLLKLLLFVLPLGLDTFAVSAALGVRGLDARTRLRASLVLAAFEAAMPVVGLFAGRALGAAIGGVAELVAGAALIGLGGWMLLADEAAEQERVGRLTTGSGLALVGLGIGISADELALGFTIGLLGLNPWLAVLLLGAQAFVFAQLGLRLGARLGEAVRESAERVAGLALVAIGVLVLAERLA